MGILSSNSTLTANHRNGEGNLFLSPSPGDSSTALIQNRGIQDVQVHGGLCRLGYVRVNNANRLRIAGVPFSSNTFFAALVRFPTYSELDALNGYVRVFETAGTINLSLNVRGGAYATTGTQQRMVVCEARQVNGSIGVTTGSNTNRGYSNNGQTTLSNQWDQAFGPWGKQNFRRRSMEWVWVLFTRSSVTEGDSGSVTLGTVGSAPIGGNTHSCGFGMHKPNSRCSGGEWMVSINGRKALGAAATDFPTTIAAADYIIGGTTGADVNMDVARIICLDNPWAQTNVDHDTITALMRGESLSAFGLTADAGTWIKDFSSLTASNQMGATVTVEAGAPVFSTTPSDGPLLNRQLGRVTPGNDLSVTIANGTVSA